MAKKATITIGNHDDAGVCTSYYSLRIREEGVTAWSALPDQFENPLLLFNLKNDTGYNLEITRHCCDQGNGLTTSAPFVYSFTSTNT